MCRFQRVRKSRGRFRQRGRTSVLNGWELLEMNNQSPCSTRGTIATQCRNLASGKPNSCREFTTYPMRHFLQQESHGTLWISALPKIADQSWHTLGRSMSAKSLRILHRAAITCDKADLPCRQHHMSWGAPPGWPSALREAAVDLEFGTIHVRVADAESTASLWPPPRVVRRRSRSPLARNRAGISS